MCVHACVVRMMVVTIMVMVSVWMVARTIIGIFDINIFHDCVAR